MSSKSKEAVKQSSIYVNDIKPKKPIYLDDLINNENNYTDKKIMNEFGDYYQEPTKVLKTGLLYNCEMCDTEMTYSRGYGKGYPLCARCYRNINEQKTLATKGRCLISFENLT